MWVRPDPLILGKEFTDEGGGIESHSDGEPGGVDSLFIAKLSGEADLPWLPVRPDVQLRLRMAQGREFDAQE